MRSRLNAADSTMFVSKSEELIDKNGAIRVPYKVYSQTGSKPFVCKVYRNFNPRVLINFLPQNDTNSLPCQSGVFLIRVKRWRAINLSGH